MGKYTVTPEPKRVTQSGMTCWAAALESWLGVQTSSPVAWHMKKEADILTEIRSWSKLSEGVGDGALIHDNGGLTKKGAGWVLDNAGLEGKGFPNPRLITGQYLHGRMSAKGHLYIIRIWSGGMAHAVVAYGIENWESAKTCKISVMDPRPDHGLELLDLSNLNTDTNVVVGWLGSAKP